MYRANPDVQWHLHIEDMHEKFGVHDWINSKLDEGDMESLKKFMEFRLEFLQEELDETVAAVKNGDAKEIVDGLIDLCVIAIGTLDAYGCDSANAWSEVMNANMKKEPGIKPSRPNPLGFPDLIKPEGWTGPDHKHCTGVLTRVYERN